MEADLVARESTLPFHAIPSAAVRGRNPLTMARNLLTLARGTLTARRLIKDRRPDAILGTGGYVCVPVFLAARLTRTPTIIYLPDVVPGLAVRLLSRLATLVACSVSDSARYLGLAPLDADVVLAEPAGALAAARLVVTGYPIRPELQRLDRNACRAAFGLDAATPTLLVAGGSRGSRSINRAIAAVLPALLPLAQIIHVCGREGDAVFLRAAVDALPDELRQRYHLYEYLHSAPAALGAQPSMIAALGAADLAVCRSGASALGELPVAGLAAVLAPYPHVHQDENADYLVRHGAAIKVDDAALLGDGDPEEGVLFRAIHRLIVRPEERQAMAERARSLARPDAAVRLASLLKALVVRRQTA